MATVHYRLLYCFIVPRHDRRRVVHFNVTTHPIARWTGQQIVEAFPYDEAPRFLIRDRDGIYGHDFRERVKHMGIEEVVIAYRSPWQSPYVERLIGSIRRECLDQMIVFNEACQEVIDGNTKYLAKVDGALPNWAEAHTPHWYLHRTVFFGYMGVRDSNNRPIVDVLHTPDGLGLYLLGYPVRIVRVAPTPTAASQADTTMAILSALRAAVVLARHRDGAELRVSEHYQFAERQVTFSLEARQDIQQLDGNATVPLKTAAS